MRFRSLVMVGTLALTTFSVNSALAARDYISIVGSSTVYPFATVVAEQFGKSTHFKTPKIESTGSGGGLKLFCGGIGIQHPDITNASRAIKDSEIKRCEANGVKDIIEVKIGYDGIVIANSKKAPHLHLSRKQLYLALAKEVPDPENSAKLIANPYKTWRDLNPSLPASRIEVYGPPPTSGTRDAFVELAMEYGAAELPSLQALKKTDTKAFEKIAKTVREDGGYIEAGENDNLIIQKLEENRNALGIFGFSYLDQNRDIIQGSIIEGEAPTFNTIADGTYPVSRPLFFYVKKAHIGVVPGIREYLAEFSSEAAWGDDGYLTDKGLIPMPQNERAKYADIVKNLTPMNLK